MRNEPKLFRGSLMTSTLVTDNCLDDPPYARENMTWDWNGQDRQVGLTISYTCSGGYSVEGTSQVHCEQGGQWSTQDLGKCVEGNEAAQLAAMESIESRLANASGEEANVLIIC